jgi:Vacuole effluxer Atg22 like
MLKAMQEITEHVYILVCLLPSRRCAVHFSLTAIHMANTFEGSYQGFSTTVTLVQICQNLRFSFSFEQNAYLGLVQGGASVIGIVAYWYVQRCWKLDSKKMVRLLAVILLYYYLCR